MNLHRYLISKQVANAPLVRQVDRRRRREMQMVAVTAFALAVAVLAYAWQHFEMIRIGYRMEELRMTRERLLRTERQLALERASLISPDRIEAIATERLGLRPPSVSQVIVIEPLNGKENADGRWVEECEFLKSNGSSGAR